MTSLIPLVMAAGFALHAAAAERPMLGLTTNVPQGGTEQDIGRGLLTAKALGARVFFVGYKWKDLEPQPGVYRFDPVDKALRGLGSLDYRVAVTIQTLDTTSRNLPADLATASFDSPQVRGRFDALLTAFAARLTDAVDCVLLANEADIYLSHHADETEAFAGFLEHARETLRKARPGTPAGLSTTFNNLRDRRALVDRLNRGMDAIVFNYYPLGEKLKVRPVAEVGGDFDLMVRAAAGKPLWFKEIGYPADPLLGSSDEIQAAFVDAVFDAVEKHAGKIRAFNFFAYYDFETRQVDGMTKYYGSDDPNFRAYLSTLGLRRADGTPRPAWRRFEERAKAFTAVRP